MALVRFIDLDGYVHPERTKPGVAENSERWREHGASYIGWCVCVWKSVISLKCLWHCFVHRWYVSLREVMSTRLINASVRVLHSSKSGRASHARTTSGRRNEPNNPHVVAAVQHATRQDFANGESCSRSVLPTRLSCFAVRVSRCTPAALPSSFHT